MTEVVALLGGLVFLGIAGLFLALPIISMARANRALQHLEQLHASIRALELQVAALKAQAAAPPEHAPAVAALDSVSTPERATAEGMPAAAPAVAPIPPVVAPAPPMAVPAPFRAKPASAERPGSTLESRIGGRWMLFVGAATVLLGVGFFVRYAFESHWITETARVGIGALTGLVLVAAGHRFVRSGYALYGQVLSGSGFVALYIAIYAAANFYDLIAPGPAFIFFVIVTISAAVIADQQRSQAMAVMAVVGGFLVPTLVSSDRDAQVFLFSYNAVLVAGTAFLAHRRGWPALNSASFIFTGLTLLAWGDRFYTPDKYLTTEFFLTVFCAMFLYILGENRRQRGMSRSTAILTTGPILYHVASLVILFDHSMALLCYLVAFTAIGLAAARQYRLDALRLGVWLGVIPPFLGWFTTGHINPQWVVPGLTIAVTLYGMHLTALLDRIVHVDEPVPATDVLALHLNALGLFAAAYVVTERMYPDMSAPVALGLAVWHAGLFRVLRQRAPEAAINAVALSFTFLAVALGLQLQGRWLTVAWAAEGAAIVWVGIESGRPWIRAGGAGLLVIAVTRLLDGYFETPAGFVAVLNARAGATLFVSAALYGVAWLYQRRRDSLPRATRDIAIAIVVANVLTVLLLSAEINSFWTVREEQPTAYLARSVMLSLTWAIYAVALTAVGIRRRYAPIRYFAILLLGITVVKVFLVDLSELGGLYRVLGFVVFGGVLLVASFLYQRYRAQIETRETT